MNGIHCAFTGRLGQDGELRFLQSGTALLSFSVAADAKEKDGAKEETQWVRVAYFQDDASDLVERLTKGVEVYVEGRARLRTWTGQDGRERTDLNVSAWKVEVLGAIGQRSPKAQGPGRERPPAQRTRNQVATAARDMYVPTQDGGSPW